MKKEHFDRISHERSLAIDAAKRLQRSRDVVSSKEAWRDLLNHIQRVHNYLNAAAKGSNAEVTWVQTQTNIRKNDELLQYAHQARHADEHGLEEVVQPQFTGYLIPPWNSGVNINSVMHSPDGYLVVDAVDDNGNQVDPLEIVALNYVRIVPVTNRAVPYAVPTSHLGQPVDVNNIAIIARQLARHIDNTVNAAAQFIEP